MIILLRKRDKYKVLVYDYTKIIAFNKVMVETPFMNHTEKRETLVPVYAHELKKPIYLEE